MNEIKKKGRPKGSTNKTYKVSLFTLCKMFNADAKIEITKGLAKLIKQLDSAADITEVVPSELEKQKSEQESKIEFAIVNP